MTAKGNYKTPPFGGLGSLVWGALFALAVVLFFGLAYPHHLHYQEQYQMFLFDGRYAWELVRLPGGVADLLGRFCTQFFLYAWAGAFIIGVMLAAVQLLTLRLAWWGWLYGLSFVPSFLLWLFLLDENALLGGVWAVLLALLASWGFDKVPEGWPRRVGLLLMAPLLYWMLGPVSLVFFLVQARRSGLSAWYAGALLLLALQPLLLAHCLPVPAARLWTGVHYHRYPTAFPTMLWVAALSASLLPLPAHALSRWMKGTTRPVALFASFVLVAACMGTVVWKNCNFKAEKIMQYDFMARHQQWNRILDTISKEKPNNQIGVTVQNLALAMRGQLINRLAEYNQNGMLGLLPDVQRDATSSLPTAEAFYQLGMTYAAQRTVYEAQEAILDFQKSARCYKRLAETNLINGSYDVARKYLMVLEKTLFYRNWARETMALLGNEEAIAHHPEYGHLRLCAPTEDCYFGDHLDPKMLESLYLSHPDNGLAYQYMMASFLLTGNRESFMHYATKKQ